MRKISLTPLSIKTPWGCLALGVLSVLCHWQLLKVGLSLHNSDFAVFSLFAQELADGNSSGVLSPFYFQQPWGGSTFTLLRVPFLFFHSLFSTEPFSHLTAHFAFLYLLNPILMTLASFFLVRAYCSASAAWIVGTIAAIGLQFWVHIYGNDFYFAYLFPSIALLIWRTRIGNPIRDLSVKQLVVSAILSGFILYSYRAGIIFVLAFYIDWDWIVKQLRRVLRPKDLLEKILLGGSLALVGLYFLLRFFDEEAGQWGEKTVKLHAIANLKLALPLFLLLCLKILRPQFKKKNFQRLGLLALGFLIGFLPEILYRIRNGFPPDQGLEIAWFPEAMAVLIHRFPTALRELMTGYDHLNHHFGVERIGSWILGLASFIAILLTSIWNVRLRPLGTVALFSTLLFLVVKTYDHGPTRYLMPLTPALLVGMGVLWDRAKSHRLIGAVVIAALVLHVTYTLRERHSSVRAYQASEKTLQMKETVRIARRHQLPVVVSDDYWFGSNYSLLSRNEPPFISTGRQWGPEAGPRIARRSSRIGILLTQPPLERSEFRAFGRVFQMRVVKRFQNTVLYEGSISSK